MKAFIFTFLLIFPLFLLDGMNFIKGEIEYQDGTTVTGFIGFPLHKWDDKVHFKKNEEDKAERLDATNMKSMFLKNEDELIQMVYVRILERTEKNVVEMSEDKKWCIVHIGCKDVLILSEGSVYTLHRKKGLMLMIDRYSSNLIYLLKNGDDFAETVGFNFEVNKRDKNLHELFKLRNLAYFKDYPEIVTKIENNEYNSDIALLLKDFCPSE